MIKAQNNDKYFLKESNFIFQILNKRYFKSVLQLLIGGYLVYQISQIGWKNLLVSIPLNPLFYLIYIIIYISLPTLEYIIYAKKWDVEDWSLIRILFKKKVLNTDIIGYSGEIFLYNWAKKNVYKNKSKIIYYIKDNNIISSLASWIISVVLLLYFISNGYINIDDIFLDKNKNTMVFYLCLFSTLFIYIIFYFKNYIIHVKF